MTTASEFMLKIEAARMKMKAAEFKAGLVSAMAQQIGEEQARTRELFTVVALIRAHPELKTKPLGEWLSRTLLENPDLVAIINDPVPPPTPMIVDQNLIRAEDFDMGPGKIWYAEPKSIVPMVFKDDYYDAVKALQNSMIDNMVMTHANARFVGSSRSLAHVPGMLAGVARRWRTAVVKRVSALWRQSRIG